MKTSKKKFVLVFLASAFAFQFITNSLLESEVGLFPSNGEWFKGTDSPDGWKRILATVIYPVKLVLIKPLSFLGQDPDPPPPLLLVAFAAYWATLAWVFYYLLRNVGTRRTKEI
jgi:hypothetical protein